MAHGCSVMWCGVVKIRSNKNLVVVAQRALVRSYNAARMKSPDAYIDTL